MASVNTTGWLTPANVVPSKWASCFLEDFQHLRFLPQRKTEMVRLAKSHVTQPPHPPHPPSTSSSPSLSPPRLCLLHWFVCLFRVIKGYFFHIFTFAIYIFLLLFFVWDTIHSKVNRVILKHLIQCHFVYSFVLLYWLNTTNRKSFNGLFCGKRRLYEAVKTDLKGKVDSKLIPPTDYWAPLSQELTILYSVIYLLFILHITNNYLLHWLLATVLNVSSG